ALAADRRGHPDRHLDAGHDPAELGDGRAEVAGGGVGRDDRAALLTDAADLSRPGRDVDIRDRGERYRALAAGVHDQRADLLDRGRARIDAADQHIDLLLAQFVARRDVPPHARDHAVGELAYGQPKLCRALLVEHDLYFRVAGLDGRLDVAEGRARLHAEPHLFRGLAQPVEVVAGDRDLERRREAEERGAAELVLHAGELLESRA